MKGKKLLAMLICIAMCVSLFPTWAFAADDTLSAESETEQISGVVDNPEEELPEQESEQVQQENANDDDSIQTYEEDLPAFTDPSSVHEDDNTPSEEQTGKEDSLPGNSASEDVNTVVTEEPFVEENQKEMEETVSITDSATASGTITPGGEDNEALFASFVDRAFGIDNRTKAKASRSTAGSRLEEEQTRTVYDFLASKICSIEDGCSTVFVMDLADLGVAGSYMPDDLGVDAIIVDGAISQTAKEAAQNKVDFDLSSVIDALLADFPYEMFWYDKTIETESSTSFQFEASSGQDGETMTVSGEITFSLPVSKDFSASGTTGTYVVGTVFSTVDTAVSNAQRIIAENSGLSDYDKLAAYKEEICTLTGYNTAAADESTNTPYGNPWQLIWVFDGDESTSVVCEGYSKAFQYLCDQSSFDSDLVECCSVTGIMTGGTGEGPHMWNLVTMDTGRNYLVDVTNCDTGTIGEPNLLFLAGTANGSVSDSYIFDCDGTSISYTYDEDTRSLYTEEELTVSENNYTDEPLSTDNSLLYAYANDTEYWQAEIVVEYGESTTLCVDAAVNAGEIHYQWYEQDNYFYTGSTEKHLLEGETEPSYQLAAVTEPQKYVCRVSSDGGDYTEVLFTVCIENGFYAFAYGTESDSEEVTVAPGERTTLKLTAHANQGAIHYKWLLDYDGYIEDAEEAEYTTEALTESADYTGYAWDDYGNIRMVNFIVHVEGTESQKAGDDITWSLDNGTLTLTGIGEIWNYATEDDYAPPWYNYRDEVLQVVVSNGITSIGSWTFAEMPNLAEVIIPDSVVTIGEDAFANSIRLTEVALPAALATLGDYAFYGSGLTSVALPESVTTLGEAAFMGCRSLTSVTVPLSLREIGYGCFAGCDTLSTVIYNGTEDQWNQISIAEGNDPLWNARFPHEHVPGEPVRENVVPATYTETGSYDEVIYCSICGVELSRESKIIPVKVDTGLYAYANDNTWESADVTVPYGGTTTLHVNAWVSTGDIHYQWYEQHKVYNENEEARWEEITLEGETAADFTTKSITEYTEYVCRVSDDYDNSVRVWFNVSVDNEFHVYANDSTEEYADVVVNYGEPAELRVSASVGQGDLRYQWYRMEKEYNDEGSDYWYTPVILEGETGTTYTTETNCEYASYQCQVTDIFGTTKSAWFDIYIENGFNAFAAGTRRTNTTVNCEAGEDATLTVEASAIEGGFTYQWYWSENKWGARNEIYGATGESYTIPNVTEAKYYYCVVSDLYGTSVEVMFHVVVGLTQLASPTDVHWITEYSEGDLGKPGFVQYTVEQPSQNIFGFSVCRVNADETEDEVYTTTMYYGGSTQLTTESIHFFASACEPETGDYRAYIWAVGDEEEYYDSERVPTEIWHYVKPEVKLAPATDISIEGRFATWTNPTDREYLGGYWIDIYFSETENGTLRHAGGIWSYNYTGGNTDSFRIYDDCINNNGSGYYSVRIRMLSNDITAVQNSDWSEMSPRVYLENVEHEHKPGDPVRENEIPATCGTEGSYEEAVYCTVCGEELSRETKSIPKTDHTPGEAVVENEIQATCGADGSYEKVVYCEVCGEELSRETIVLPKSGDHSPGEPKHENKTDPTCTAAGSYDEVTYCTVCEEELSRETITVPATGHSYTLQEWVWAKDGYSAQAVFRCETCGEEETADADVEVTEDEYGSAACTATVVFSGENQTDTRTKPAIIGGFIADGDYTGIVLSWNMSREILTDTYLIYRRAENESDFTLQYTVQGRSILTWKDTETAEDTVYYYYIVGENRQQIESKPSETVSASLLTDTIAPRVTKLTPANNSTLTGTVSVGLTAQDNVTVASAELYYLQNNSEEWVLFAESDNAQFTAQLDTTAFADGTLKVKGIAYDAAGNSSDAMVYTYCIDNTGPEQVQNLAAQSTSVTVTLSWSDVSDNDIASYHVEQLQANGSYQTAAVITTTLGANLYNLTPDTDYNYRVVAYDALGNRGIPSESITVRTLADTTAPNITRIRPTAGYVSDSIALSITAEDDYTIRNITVQTSTDTVDWTDVYSKEYSGNRKQTLSWSLPLADYAEGSVYVRALAEDAAGNISNSGVDAPYVQYIIDRTAPAAPDGLSAEGGNGYVKLAWEQGTEEDLATYAVYRANSENGNYQLLQSGLKTISWYDRSAKAGVTYFYKLNACDIAGNTSEYSVSVSGTALEDTISPEIRSISPADGSTVGTGYKTVTVTATDNAELDSIRIECSTDGQQYSSLLESTGILNNCATVSVNLPLEQIQDGGAVHVRVSAVDTAGNTSETVEYTYTVDVTAPIILSAQAAYEDGKITIDWTGNQEEDLIGYRVYRSVNGQAFRLIAQLGAKSGTSAYSWEDYDLSLEEMSYVYSIEALDSCGNQSAKATDAVQTPDRSYPVPVINCESTMAVGVEYVIDASQSRDNTAIVSYSFDFGDGTTSEERAPIHRYQTVGTYVITLTITDEDGHTAVCTKEIAVKEPATLGTAIIRIVDEDGNALPNAPVYFDLGEETQVTRTTGTDGTVRFLAEAGRHTVGSVIANNEWLPVKSEIIVLAGKETSITMILIHQQMIEGEFEIHRMNFDEIVAAGIDINAEENQHNVQVNLRVSYGESQLNTSFVYNPVTGASTAKPSIVETSDGKKREVTPVVIYVHHDNTGGGGGSGGSGGGGWSYNPKVEDYAVALLDIPVGASFLKEFFDVKLHIFNNASSEFRMQDNVITLNLPDGLSIVETAGTEANSTVTIAEIPGQTSSTIAWILRGDKQGEYNISANYSGILSEFNEAIQALFVASTPIKVNGLGAVKMIAEFNSSIYFDAFYFNLSLKNISDADIYLPAINIINNAISTYMNSSVENEDGSTGTLKDRVSVRHLNSSLSNAAGFSVPIGIDQTVDTLSPGETLTNKYAAYNVVDYNNMLLFMNAIATVAEGYGIQVEIVNTDMDLYSTDDALAKLNDINNDSSKAISFFDVSGNSYYYIWESLGRDTNFWGLMCEQVYGELQAVLNLDLNYNKDKTREITRKLIAQMLQDEAAEEAVTQNVDAKFLKITSKILNSLADQLESIPDSDDPEIALEIALIKNPDNMRKYMTAFKTEGEEGLRDRIETDLLALGISTGRMYIIQQAYWDDGIASGLLEGVKEVTQPIADVVDKVTMVVEAWEDSVDLVNDLVEISAAYEEAEWILQTIISNTQSAGWLDDDVRGLIYDEAVAIRRGMEDAKTAQRNKLIEGIAQGIAEDAAKALVKKVCGAAGGKVYILMKAAFAILDYTFDWAGTIQDTQTLRVQTNMGAILERSIHRDASTNEEAVNTLKSLKYIIKLRMLGEQSFIEIMKKADADDIQQVLAKINSDYGKQAGKEFKTLDEYLYYRIARILQARDSLYSTHYTTLLIPEAPQISINCVQGTTNQAFGPNYEYSFDGTHWEDCTGEKIAITPKTVTTYLDVRLKETTESVSGDITRVAIPPKARLMGDFTAEYGNGKYIVSGLPAGEYYYSATDEKDLTDAQISFTVEEGQTYILLPSATQLKYIAVQTAATESSFRSQLRYLLVSEHEHTPGETVIENEVAATCAAEGSYDEVVYCTVCGEEISREAKTVEKIAHISITDAAVAASCEETGLTEGSHCSVCNEVLVAQETIPALGHTTELRNGKDATCTEDGYTGDEVCTVCGKTVKAGEIIPALGHDWDDGAVTTEPTCTEAGVRTYTCKHDDSHTRTEEIAALGHTAVTDAAVAASCEETGLTEGSHCSVCGEVLVAQETIPALGHLFVFRRWDWAEDYTIASAVYVCTHDESHIEIVKVPATSEILPNTAGVVYTAEVLAEESPDGDLQQSSEVAFKTGWIRLSNGNWYYLDENSCVATGWRKIGGAWYYFSDAGDMVTGWQTISDKRYYFSGSGAMQTGWQKIGNVWYYFNAGGDMVTGWKKIGDTWYYFSDAGEMVTGWQTISDKRYYFSSSGAMQTGWQKIGSVWYYFSSSGAMQTGWQKIDNVWYYFNKGGEMVTGWQTISDKRYYFSSSGAMQTGWQKIDNVWYYFNTGGDMVTGWQTISDKRYHFSSSGAMETGWQKIDNVWYYFNSGGDMVTGWQTISDKRYHFSSSGVMQTGWQKIDNVWYYFSSSGAMQTGWQKIDNMWYYFNTGGDMVTGWQKISNKWYYFESGGAMLADTSKSIGGKTYNFDAGGVCTNP